MIYGHCQFLKVQRVKSSHENTNPDKKRLLQRWKAMLNNRFSTPEWKFSTPCWVSDEVGDVYKKIKQG